MINKYHPKILILGIFLVVFLFSGFSCVNSNSDEVAEISPVNITYWRVWDSSDKFSEIIGAYEAKYPHVNINYRKLRYEEFEEALYDSWVRGSGPDIISIHNTWMKRYLQDIDPMPAKTTMPVKVMEGPSWRQREAIEQVSKSLPTINTIKTDYVDVVYDDIIHGGQIYGLPLSIDTLVLFYNEDILNNAGMPQPPRTWEELKEAVKELTLEDEEGNIVQSGVAMGTANNIPRSMDILALLMIQNGTQMMSGSTATFNLPAADNPRYFPGREALKFYTDFADPTKEVYSWNSTMDNALNEFTAGKVAFFFGYSFHLDQIKSRAPKLNFGVSTMPQIANNKKQVNYASYWIETVSKRSLNKQVAWDFISFAAAKENVEAYLNKANKPTAIKSLISKQLNDLDLQPFATQALTAESWYQGRSAEYVEDVFKNMIKDVNSGEKDYQGVLERSATLINSGVY